MRARWPFFSTRIDMLEMVLAKADADIARRYDERLVQPELLSLGSDLRDRLSQVIEAVLSLTGQSDLLDHSPKTQEAFSLRNTYLDPLHLMQTELLARSRQRQGPAESPRAGPAGQRGGHRGRSAQYRLSAARGAGGGVIARRRCAQLASNRRIYEGR